MGMWAEGPEQKGGEQSGGAGPSWPLPGSHSPLPQR